MIQPIPPAPHQKQPMVYNRLASCPDMESAFTELYEQTRRFTMTSVERMYALYQATQHISRHGIEGDMVECGVWKGGSAMLAAATLRELIDTDRTLWLYDTFEGMVPPEARDVRYDGLPAGRMYEPQWFRSPIEEVSRNLASTGYPAERTRLVPGRVQETIPQHAPDRIALLRLDTDWHDSTLYELTHLFPRLVSGGVLIIDDYGHWQGCREAVDRYFRDNPCRILLTRIDYTGRIGVKP